MNTDSRTDYYLGRLKIFRSRSTEVNKALPNNERNLVLNGTAYYTFAAYLLVTTIILSDAQILTANTGFTLPIISLDVPFLGFFILAPLALLILHFHALGSVVLSNEKLNKDSQVGAIDRHGKAVKIFFCLFSPATLIVVFWRLADYQSLSISLFHTILIGVDFWLTWRAATAMGLISPDTKVMQRMIITMIMMTMVKALVCWDVFVRPWPSSFVRYLVLERDYFLDEDGQVSDRLGLIPNINIDRTKLLFDVDTTRLSSIAALHGYESWRDYFDARGVSLDIRGRSLRLAYLHGQTLPRVWAHRAQLQGSNLSFAFMPGAVFVEADLQDANLELTNLNGVYLDRAVMRDSIMIMTSMKGASLDMAQLQGAHIRQADFTAAWIPNANFSLSAIMGASFSGSYLENTKFWGALYAGPSQFILSNLEESPPINMTAPSHEELRSWKLSSPVKNVNDMKEDASSPPFSHSDAKSIDSWVEMFCTDPVGSGNEAAVKLALRLYSLVQHPIHTAFSEKLRNERACAPLLAAIAEDRTYLSKPHLADTTK